MVPGSAPPHRTRRPRTHEPTVTNLTTDYTEQLLRDRTLMTSARAGFYDHAGGLHQLLCELLLITPSQHRPDH